MDDELRNIVNNQTETKDAEKQEKIWLGLVDVFQEVCRDLNLIFIQSRQL